MYILNSNEISAVSGAANHLGANDITAMLNAGMSIAAIGQVGLTTATEEKRPDWGNNVAGDAGYMITPSDSPLGYTITRWFFDGAGYTVS
ncbi:hypothetical protein [Pantoea anthophila]|uniref:hypothetical protein n=1 Tax=Pantoea anthophila TaxID=470931 RepID=UPI00278922E9|nr:hypothetical protein [Pantoea anthophila]MDQ1214025.1 hypothetical protein [Pantoea anthophila]